MLLQPKGCSAQECPLLPDKEADNNNAMFKGVEGSSIFILVWNF
jgi:hypothetical protein